MMAGRWTGRLATGLKYVRCGLTIQSGVTCMHAFANVYNGSAFCLVLGPNQPATIRPRPGRPAGPEEVTKCSRKDNAFHVET
jgi:hypothetical protein